jgi:hypothetical protein
MIEIVASTEIDASAETVWGVLTDLERFGEWNPFIRRATGAPRVGAEVRVRVQPSIKAARLGFRATVLVCAPCRELRWRGHVIAPWLADGEHTFTIEPAPDGGVRFVQREVFRGLLPRLAGRLLAREARRGFQMMNGALRQRAESARSAQEREPCVAS